jgi:hypothetical protein
VPDRAGVCCCDRRVEGARGHGRAELRRRLQFDRAEQRLGHGLDQRDPGRVRPHLPRGEQRVQAALAVPSDEHRLRTRFPPRTEHAVGGRGLPDEGVEIDPARVLAIGPGAGPAGEVLVEAQAHDAQAGEDLGDQG